MLFFCYPASRQLIQSFHFDPGAKCPETANTPTVAFIRGHIGHRKAVVILPFYYLCYRLGLRVTGLYI